MADWMGSAITAVVAAGGIAATYWTGERGREHTERMALAAQTHTEKLASDQRVYSRMADAYVALIDLVERTAQWVLLARPLFEEGQPKPELPTLAEQASVRAAVMAYGSPEVLQLLGRWMMAVTAATREDNTIALYERRGSPHSDDAVESRRKLDLELKPSVHTATSALTDAIRAELRPDLQD